MWPGVARSGLQTHWWLSKSLTQISLSSKSSKPCNSPTVRARWLKFWETVYPPPHVMDHMSCVKCYVSWVIFFKLLAASSSSRSLVVGQSIGQSIVRLCEKNNFTRFATVVTVVKIVAVVTVVKVVTNNFFHQNNFTTIFFLPIKLFTQKTFSTKNCHNFHNCHYCHYCHYFYIGS